MRSKHIYQIITAFLFLHAGFVQAQTSNSLGTFTPYSMFGMGEMVRQGTPYNMSMGGIGVALRDHRFINYLNPASITARDTLAFMLDFGVESYNIYLKDSYTKSAFNAVNMSHIVFSFPLYRQSAMVVGFTPYSHVGYKFEEKELRPEFVSEIGDIAYQHFGEGSINQLFMGGAVSISKNFFAGVQGIYYFGTLYRNSNTLTGNSLYNSTYVSNNTVVESFAAKFGLQYAGKIGNRSVVTAGATFLLPSTLKGNVTKLATVSIGSGMDTVSLATNAAQMQIPSEFAVGISVGRKMFADIEGNINRWMAGFDYTYQDWSQTTFTPTPGVHFSPTVKSTYRFGFEFTPDYYNPRYAYKRWTYRGGLYYEETYMQLNGQQVNAMGVTFGVSFPVFRWSNMINVGVDLGQRGGMREELVRERYMMFRISTSLYDIWFRKMKYE